MTAEPRNAGDRRRWAIPDGDVADENVNVLALAGRQPPAGGAWLWVTAAGARRGGEFTALFLPRRWPGAGGGDVLVRIAPRERGTGDTGPAAVVAGVQVRAVAAGPLVRVAGWDLDSLDLWPEIVRSPVVFALGALRELQDHGADAGSRGPGRPRRGGRIGAHRVPGPAHPGEPGRVAPAPGMRGGRLPVPALSSSWHRARAWRAAVRPGHGHDGTAPGTRPGSDGTRPHGRAVARTGPVHAAARVPPAGGAGMAAAPINSRSATAACCGTTPLPMIFSWRVRGMPGTPVTNPGTRPFPPGLFCVGDCRMSACDARCPTPRVGVSRTGSGSCPVTLRVI